MSDFDRKIKRGTAWVAVASGISGVLDLVTTILCLWLWVSKDELGIATMAGAIFPLLDRFAMLGLNQAAVRYADEDRRALSSIVWTALAASLVVFAVVALAAPAIGEAFGYRMVGTLLVFYAIKVVTQNANLIPEALLRRDLAFDTLTKVRTLMIFADAGAKVVAAYLGAHYFPSLRIGCFVLAPIAGSFVYTAGLLIVRPWRPQWVFDAKEALTAVRFGLQLTVTDLLYQAYTNVDYVVVGAAFGAGAVAAYRLAYEMVLDVVKLISSITTDVAFPAFARIARERANAAEQVIRFTRRNLMLVAPLLIVIGVVADDLLAILYPQVSLGPEATTAVRVLCAVGAVRSASFILPQMLAGLGHPRDGLIYTIFASIICPAAFVIAAAVWPSASYLSVCWAWSISYPLAVALLLYFVIARTGVTLAAYARGIIPILGWAAGIAALAMLARSALPASHWLRAGGVAAVAALGYLAVFVAGDTLPNAVKRTS